VLKKKLVAADVVIGAGSMLAAVPALATTGNGTASWQVVKEFHGGVQTGPSAMTGVPGGGAWAFVGSNGPQAFERTGSGWTQMPFPAGYYQVDLAAASSPTNVWAFTEYFTSGGLQTQYRALRWNGHSWSVRGSFGLQVAAASVLAPNDVWVFGQVDGQPGNGLGAFHYNGSSRTRVADASDEGGAALADDDVWVGHQTAIGHWNGQSWQRTSVAALLPRGAELDGILAESSDNVYAVGLKGPAETFVLHYDGQSWTRVFTGAFGSGQETIQQPMTADGHGGFWLIGSVYGNSLIGGLLVHYSDGRVTTSTAPALPGQGTQLNTIMQVAGTGQMLAGGYSSNPKTPRTGIIVQYGG
jgi:hypothetical protein